MKDMNLVNRMKPVELRFLVRKSTGAVFERVYFHDLLNDLDKEVVVADIKGWIDKRLPAVAGM